MTIEGIKSAPLYQPITATAQREKGLSGSDWKAHSFVVLSYLLIGIGFALACCSIYIAATFHPMIAMASPIGPIVLGILGLQSANSNFLGITGLAGSSQVSLPGLANPGANCWINASLQLLFNAPALREIMEKLTEESESILGRLQRSLMPNSGVFVLVDVFKAYIHDEEEKRGVSSIDSQKVREWLHAQKIKIDPSARVPDDPTEFFLNPILGKMGVHLPTEVGQEITRKGDDVLYQNALKETLTYIDLTPSIVAGKTSLRKAFDYHFKHEEQLPDGKVREIVRYLQKAPEHICVSNPSASEAGKVVTPLQDAMSFTLTAGQVGEQAEYTCDAFIVHEGGSIDDGHYIAYILKEGSWCEASDSVVRKISLTQANAKLSTASFIHYQRTLQVVVQKD